MATATHSLPAETRGLSHVGPHALFSRIVTRLQAHYRRARELRELRGFDDRELRDLGLSRSDFMAIEKGSFHRD
jgi:uncharacterized protein YjiS (DUF1127 family)